VISATAAELLNVTSFQEAIGQTVTFRISIEVPVEPDPNAPPTSIQGPPKTTTENVDIPAKVTGIIDDELTVGYLPIEVLRKAQAKNDYNLARVKVNEREKLTPVRKEIESLGYQVDSIADTVGQIDQIFLVFEIVMAGFGLIAMLVASLGAFNTLTVSLLERTREVGIMKALGTTSKDVYRLFISESFLIGITGGASGLILGYGTGEILNLVINYLAKRYGGQPVDIFYTPLLLVVMVLGIISIVSFVTGVYPARRASKLNPLNALRYE
jgi:putative ABC transport system permease protein